jgi:zinc-binding alcohol dehydrogenase family protein
MGRNVMKAVGYFEPGAIAREDALLDLTIAEPMPRPRDLLVRVRAVSVNPVDVKVRASTAAPDGGAKILGWDAAGVVEAVGSDVTLFRPGDHVFYAGDISRAGTNAELHLVDERIVGHKPRTLDWAEAAALPLTAITAWELLFDRLRVSREARDGGAGQALLVIGGAGGVGSILIQLARQLTGLTVVVTASRPETAAWVRRMGAHHVVDHSQPLPEQMAALGLPEVEYVASLTASDLYLPVLPQIVAAQGHVALIDDPASFDIVPLKRKAISVSWEFMFARPLFATADMIEQHHLLEEVSRLVDQGVLSTTLNDAPQPLTAANLKRAHALLESGRSMGKIALVSAV